ncbi:MAG: hypothetical protein V4667_01110 [Bacteroidota bacterium]
MQNKLPIPSSLMESLTKVKGFDASLFKLVHEQASPVSLRLNPKKSIPNFKNEEKVKWADDAFYLKERPQFIFDPYFHAGCYYVQEASSMFIEYIFKQHKPQKEGLNVLDLCAAPGGKSTLLASLLNENDLLIANEVIKSRVPILGDNLAKWGNTNAHITNNDPKDFSKINGFFDVVVVDAPCSGSGLFRKDNDAISHWSEENVEMCSKRQQRILSDVVDSIAKDGLLIYSTCSYSEAENEEIADFLISTGDFESIRINTPEDFKIVETQSNNSAFGYRFFPHLTKGEGFFVSAFRKVTGSTIDINYKKIASTFKSINAAQQLILAKFIDDDKKLIPVFYRDEAHIILESHKQKLNYLAQHLYFYRVGIKAGSFKGNDFIPDHHLALSFIKNEYVAHTNLSLEEAIHYLKREEVKLDNLPKGWCVVCFDHFALGWVKSLGNRINNYFPKELRVLKEYIAPKEN